MDGLCGQEVEEGIGGMMEGGVLKKVLRYSGRCMNDI